MKNLHGRKGKDGEATGEEGNDSEKRIARKGWRGEEGNDGEVRTARKG